MRVMTSCTLFVPGSQYVPETGRCYTSHRKPQDLCGKRFAPSGDDFMQIVDAVTPRADGVVALIQAYFDESYGDGGVFCVAGYAFSRMKCRQFDAAWRAMLMKYRLPYFRMSSCAHNRGAFAHLTPDECIAVEKEAITLIKRYVSCGFAVTVDPADFAKVAGQPGVDKTPYEFCVSMLLTAVSVWVERPGHAPSEISYFFEAGTTKQGETSATMERVFRDPHLRERYGYMSHTFVSKENARPAQAADLLAWQWFTDHKRRKSGKFKGPRKDLAALVDGTSHEVFHADEDMLREIGAKIAEIRARAAVVSAGRSA